MTLPRHICPLCLAATAILPLPAPAAFDVGNGGDVVSCPPAEGQPYAGLYALDFLATESDSASPLVPVESWQSSRSRIESLLRDKAPALRASFARFSDLVLNSSDYRAPYVWEESKFGLVDLKDEQLVARLPENCRSGEHASVIQAIIRQNPSFSGTAPTSFIFRYDPKILLDLQATSPLQFSFLMVHEWLWDLSKNVDRNRRINRFLHSRRATELSAQEFQAQLEGMGLRFPEEPSAALTPNACAGTQITLADLGPDNRACSGRPMGILQPAARYRVCNAQYGCEDNWQELVHADLGFTSGAHVMSCEKPSSMFGPRMGLQVRKGTIRASAAPQMKILIPDTTGAMAPVPYFSNEKPLHMPDLFDMGDTSEHPVVFTGIVTRNCVQMTWRDAFVRPDRSEWVEVEAGLLGLLLPGF